jgi:hypothetical protein
VPVFYYEFLVNYVPYYYIVYNYEADMYYVVANDVYYAFQYNFYFPIYQYVPYYYNIKVMVPNNVDYYTY